MLYPIMLFCKVAVGHLVDAEPLRSNSIHACNQNSVMLKDGTAGQQVDVVPWKSTTVFAC